MDCLFCGIVSGAIPARKIFEDDQVIAFHDIHPQAPVHILVLPKRHIVSLAHLEAAGEDPALMGHLFAVTSELARALKLDHGCRTVINTGPDGGQTVDHLHIHLLGGRPMTWPPG
jgi:histidine triad (HIT) family protein